MVMDDRAAFERISTAICGWGKEEQAKGSRLGQLMARFEERYLREGRDTVFWGAPCLIIAYPKPGRFIPSPRDSAIFSLLYAQLYAPALGLGTCWSGLLEAAAKHPAVLEALRPHEPIAIAGAVMAGYPKHAHPRPVAREPADPTGA